MSGPGGGRPSVVSASMSSGSPFNNMMSGMRSNKPVPMKLFATWEVERTPPNCIPRLCSLTLARIALFKALDADLSSIIIAVKMQSSKRTLRSNEIVLPSTGLLDTELELTFSLQYPHFLKREGNKLQIMLQRRKKYKNRTILGYKTLAVGIINMSQVLQKQMDLELELISEGKGNGSSTLGKVYMLSLSSQPVDHEEPGKQMVLGDHNDRGEIDSDEDEDFSSPDEGSDSEPMIDDPMTSGLRRKASKSLSNSAARQRNLRQKFVALLRRFKVNEPEELNAFKHIDKDVSLHSEGTVDPEEIEDLINELEDLSDSGPDGDNISVGSTPKPSLRPFFSSSRSLIREALDNPGSMGPGYSILEKPDNMMNSDHMSDDSSKGAVSDSHPETFTDQENSDNAVITSSPPHSGDEIRHGRSHSEKPDRRSKLFNKDKSGGFSLKQTKSGATQIKDRLERINSGNGAMESTSPRKVLLEQLSRILPPDDSLPDQVILANTCDNQAAHLSAKLADTGSRVINTAGPADVRATLTCLVTKLQKFCNTNVAPPSVMRVGLIGSDAFLNSMLRPYVELFSGKPPDWQNHILFYVIPLGVNTVSRGLAARCPLYARLFLDDSWRDLLDKAEPSKVDVAELVSRVQQYLNTSYTNHLSIAEAMVTYKEKVSDEESCQVFVPFVSDVRVGGTHDPDVEDNPPSLTSSHSHGNNPFLLDRPRGGDRLTPPSSPNISAFKSGSVEKDSKESSTELMELQLDYWMNSNNRDSKLDPGGKDNKDSEKSKKQDSSSKSSIRTTFRSLSIVHLSTSPLLTQHTDSGQHTFSMTYITKEKKPKAVLKLGKKKEKSGEGDAKLQNIDGITRLICLSKSSQPLRVSIDGAEWSGVKFFQLSSQWQTHIKHLPVAVGSNINETL